MKQKQTRCELFFSGMDAVVPWGRLLALIEPRYPKGGDNGRAATDAAGDDASGLLAPEPVCAE